MKVFFVGDFDNNTGPSIANQLLIKGLDKRSILVSKQRNKALRVIEFILKLFLCSDVCFCSFSKFNRIGIGLSKMFNKNIYYLMHGYRSYEYEINNSHFDYNEYTKIKDLEQFVFRHAKVIFCVSKAFMKFMIEKEPEFKEKFDFNYNGLDISYLESFRRSSIEKKRYQVISLGGTMPQKNNIKVCEAINNLRKNENLDIKYIVIGKDYANLSKLKDYDFVEYYESLSHDEVLKIMSDSELYIQNSFLETFGLAIVEAICCGCKILISKDSGVIDIINNINNEDIILDVMDVKEIMDKILIKFKNQCDMKTCIDLNLSVINYETAGKDLLYKIRRNQVE